MSSENEFVSDSEGEESVFLKKRKQRRGQRGKKSKPTPSRFREKQLANPKGAKENSESDSDLDAPGGSSTALSKIGAQVEDPLKNSQKPLPATKVVQGYRASAASYNSSMADTQEESAKESNMATIGRAVLALVMGFLPEQILNLLTGFFHHSLFFCVVDEKGTYADLIFAGPNVPATKKVLLKYGISPTDPNTIRAIVCKWPVWITLGAKIVIYVPTPQFLRGAGAISRDGFINGRATLEPDFTDPTDVTQIVMSTKPADVGNNYNVPLECFVLVMINRLKVDGSIPMEYGNTINSSLAAPFNGVVGAAMLRAVAEESQMITSSPPKMFGLLSYLLKTKEEKPAIDVKQMYIDVLRAFMDGFKKAGTMAHTWSAALPAISGSISVPPALAPPFPFFAIAPPPPPLKVVALFLPLQLTLILFGTR